MPSRNNTPATLAAIGAAALTLLLQGCFTGVEGTGKINLSKKDMVATAPTAEDLLLSDVPSPPLRDWGEGKRFVVADEKFRLVAEVSGDYIVNAGDTIIFSGMEASAGPGGGGRTVLSFTRPGARLQYAVDKPLDEASASYTTSELPMLIDLDAVEAVREKLKGRKVWTRTALWYGDSLQHLKGRKFVGVTISDVVPGNAFFPLLVSFADDAGNTGRLLMNTGNTGNESRNFGKLFSLSDPKNSHRQISAENWAAIQNEEVRAGMTKEEAKLARGNPSDIDTGHNYSNAMEIWYYPDGTFLRFVDGLLVGGQGL